MNLSIVIPVNNEAATLEAALSAFLHGLPPDLAAALLEVILVENGSSDGTLEVCRHLEAGFPHLVRVCTIPLGSYGEAIKKGMLESRGTHVSILECDFLYPQFLSASLAVFRENRASFVVGSKRHPQSVDRRPFKRRLLTALYNLFFLRLCIGYPGTDTHGLKSIESALARKLCGLAVTTDEVFQTEIVLLAWRLGVRIEEVPLQIQETRSPTVTVVRRVPKVLNTVRELQRSLRRFPRISADNSEHCSDAPRALSGR